MAMWGGRFAAGTDQLVADMSESVSYDSRLYAHDVQQSTAHVRMLARQGIVSDADADACADGLAAIKRRIDDGTFGAFDTALEDIHMNIERRLTDEIGEAGAKLHAGRSRNDQIATDFRLYLRDEFDALVALARRVQRALVEQAGAHTETIMPGLTHLQHAQPIVLGHHLLAYCEMFERDVGRLLDARRRMNACPLGSGAMATSTLPVDRQWTAQQLRFDAGPCRNSMDAVSDRDFAVELLAALSTLMMHLSRLSEDLVFWTSHEAAWVDLDDRFCTGSSLMPQKKNPDVCELARGKTGRVYGDLMSLLTTLKGMPLCYNRDMQEDKEPVFDAVDTVKRLLAIFADMLASMRPRAERMLAAASDPALMATDLAEWLVRHGVPFRQAHHRVGALVGQCGKHGKALNELTLAEMRESVPEATEECLRLFDPAASVRARTVFGGTAPEQVRQQVAFWRGQEWYSDAAPPAA